MRTDGQSDAIRALLMLTTRCMSVSAATRAISPAVFFVVAASLALGKALVVAGATDYLTELFLFATGGASPVVIIAALMTLLAVLTNVVSKNAATVIGTPNRHRHRRPPRPAPRTLRAGGPVRRQHELRHPDGLQDQPAGDERRRLPLQRIRARRYAADLADAGGADAALVVDVSLTGRQI